MIHDSWWLGPLLRVRGRYVLTRAAPFLLPIAALLASAILLVHYPGGVIDRRSLGHVANALWKSVAAVTALFFLGLSSPVSRRWVRTGVTVLKTFVAVATLAALVALVIALALSSTHGHSHPG